MDSDDLQFYSLYVSRFAGGFGFSALALLLPKYANALDASGIMLGLFYTGFTATQALVVVPLAWAFYVGGAFALTGVATFVAILVRSHGAKALTEW